MLHQRFRRRVGGQTVIGNIELHVGTHKSLQQGVVQVAGNPFPLLETFFQPGLHVTGNLPEAEGIKQPENAGNDDEAPQPKPCGLIKRWQYREDLRRTGVIPHPIAVPSDDVKGVFAGLKMGIISGAPRAGIDPV